MMRRTRTQMETAERSKWRPCKIGTKLALVILDGRSVVAIGRKIRFRYYDEAHRWHYATVDRINPDGYFFASL